MKNYIFLLLLFMSANLFAQGDNGIYTEESEAFDTTAVLIEASNRAARSLNNPPAKGMILISGSHRLPFSRPGAYWVFPEDVKLGSGGSGSVGPQGPQGEQGETGPAGAQGIQGDTGPAGAQGVQGDTGPAGAQGVQGDTGPAGAQGIQGDTGPAGAQGAQGIQGDAGTQGIQGIQGPPGEDGNDGATGPQGPQGFGAGTPWFDDSGAPGFVPSESVAYYLDNSNGDVWEFSGGGWGITGNIQGADGSVGTPWFDGSGTPPFVPSEPSAYYLDTSNGDVWEFESGAWGIIGNIAGSTGADGTQWYDGTGDPTGFSPSNPLAYWLNTTTGDVWEYNSSFDAWAVAGNILGPQGAAGAQGVQGDAGPAGAQGVQGDAGPAGAQGVQGDTGPAGAQGVQGDTGPAGAQGDAGPAGAQGIQGDAGSTWGSDVFAAPNAGTTVGDQWLNTNTGDIEQWNGSAWIVTGNILGPAGPTGAQGSQGSTGSDGTGWSADSGAPSFFPALFGELYLNTDNGDVYEYQSAANWVIIDNLTGPAGAGIGQTLSFSNTQRQMTISDGNTVDVPISDRSTPSSDHSVDITNPIFLDGAASSFSSSAKDASALTVSIPAIGSYSLLGINTPTALPTSGGGLLRYDVIDAGSMQGILSLNVFSSSTIENVMTMINTRTNFYGSSSTYNGINVEGFLLSSSSIGNNHGLIFDNGSNLLEFIKDDSDDYGVGNDYVIVTNQNETIIRFDDNGGTDFYLPNLAEQTAVSVNSNPDNRVLLIDDVTGRLEFAEMTAIGEAQNDCQRGTTTGTTDFNGFITVTFAAGFTVPPVYAQLTTWDTAGDGWGAATVASMTSAQMEVALYEANGTPLGSGETVKVSWQVCDK